MTDEQRAAAELLKTAGYTVIRSDRIVALNATAFIDEYVFTMTSPPEDYIHRKLAVSLANELSKVWWLTVKHIPNEGRREYTASVWVATKGDANDRNNLGGQALHNKA